LNSDHSGDRTVLSQFHGTLNHS